MPAGLRPAAPPSHALEPWAEVELSLTGCVALSERMPLVVRLLALGQSDLDLGPDVLEVEREGNDRQAPLGRTPLDPVDLLPVEQHLAATARLVVGPRALR